MTVQNIEAVGPGLAAVNNDGAAGTARQVELFDEDALLNVARRMVVVIVEADLADGQEFGVLGQSGKLFVMGLGGELGFVRMNSGGGVDPGKTRGEGHRRSQRAGGSADGQNVAHTGRLRPGQHVHAIRVEFGHVQVGMRIDQFKLLGG